MFETYDYETILNNMLENVDDSMDKREGSIIYDALAPCALELSNFYQGLDIVLDEVFADSASYAYLAKRAAERGILPHDASPAVLQMSVTPTNSPVTVGDRFFINDLNFTVTDSDSENIGIYSITCDTAGSSGNLQSGSLIPADTNEDLSNMETASITAILIPGSDEEDEEDFRNRYFSSFSNVAFGGNKQDYINMIMEFDGVGACKIFRYHWEEYDDSIDDYVVAYNVVVAILDSQFKEPSTTLINTIQEALYPENGDGLAPIGHMVKVLGVEEDGIYVDIDATYSSGYSFNSLKTQIEDIVEGYFEEVRRSWADANFISLEEDGLTLECSVLKQRLSTIIGISSVNDVYIDGHNDSYTLYYPTYIPVVNEVGDY